MTALRHTVIRRLDVGHDRRPGWRFVAGFDDPDEADALRRELDSQAKTASGNPFAFADFGDLCSLPEFAYADWVQEAGVSPPSPRANGSRNWAAWWDDRVKFWTPRQVAHIRDGLDGFRFFELRSRPLIQTAFVLVEPLWEFVQPDDEFRQGAWDEPILYGGSEIPPGYYSGDDGGRVLHACRTAADARARQELYAEARVLPPDYQWVRRWVPGWWLGEREFPGRFRPLNWYNVPPAFVHEAEYDETGGPAVRDQAFVVRRLGWTVPSGRLRPDEVAGDIWDIPERRATPEVVCSRPEVAEAGRQN